ncbi:MAG: DUF1367 family protein [Comamonas sp.]|jgi:hypothetical protein|nr:DUF1367 family protein [Comamonas sp.]
MTRLVITKGQDGKLCGSDAAGHRAYARFKNAVNSLKPGETLGFQFWLPRSPEHHRFFFLRINRLLDRTEAFEDASKLRAWLLMGAGHCDFVPGLDGKPNAVPKRMDFESMDEAAFCELHRDIDQFLWTEHAQLVLWPTQNAQQRWASMESFFGEFRQ